MDHKMRLLLLCILAGACNAFQNVMVISMINQNVTVAIAVNRSYAQSWFYQELGSDRLVEMNMTDENLTITSFQFAEAGRKYLLKNNSTNEVLKVVHTIGIDDKCEIKDTVAGRSVVSKGQHVTLACSIKVKKNLLGNNDRKLRYNFHSIDDPISKWLSPVLLAGNKTENTVEWESDSVIRYSSKATLRIPDDDESVWKMKSSQIGCQVSHESSYEVASELKLPASTLATTSCSFNLNVNFSPFISQRVNKTQFLHGNELSAIECPIKAPNFQPYRYSIAWYHIPRDSLNDSWTFKYSKVYDNTGDLFVISSAKYNVDDGKYKCELTETGTRSVLFEAVLSVDFNATFKTFETQKSSSILASTLGKVALNVVFMAVFVAVIIFLVLKLRANKASMRITNVLADTQEPPKNGEANLKYELTNLQSNRPFEEDDPVYKENSVAVGDDASIMRRLANIDTRKCMLHLAGKLKHKKTCELYQPTDSSFNETSSVMSTYRSEVNQKSVHFNLLPQQQTAYDSSEYMESIYINGFSK